ncbi:SigE family RNA polymerase sigma factor [Hamadaea tsunoensis]|uniref:SigE family RNA polymerase sigma factor n=1 Tax=Hamadaea tsunoensis TaxID=53368 RepID=UPI000685BE39|nr:SigE family RNA polymerase sigma factor [Hamadaea tsunoensis]
MRSTEENEYVEYVRSRLPRLHRVAYLVLGDADRADDAVQDALAVLYRRWNRLAGVSSLDAYVHTMVVRACLAYQRRSWARVLLRGEPPDRTVAPDTTADDRLVLRAALRRLPERQRAAVILRFLCDLPVDETARVLGCSEGTVKSRVHHGLRALRTTLRDRTHATPPAERTSR